MGTPCAYAYTSIFFTYFERPHKITQYKEKIKLYLRKIDDILLIQKNNILDPHANTSFKYDLQKQCKLKWTTNNLRTGTNFFDLIIKIEKSCTSPRKFIKKDESFSIHSCALFTLSRTYKKYNLRTPRQVLDTKLQTRRLY